MLPPSLAFCPEKGVTTFLRNFGVYQNDVTSQKIAHYYNTGLFISPSGISDLCDTVTGMVTPKENMSTEGETLQVSVLP
jgi:hypothetical protein